METRNTFPGKGYAFILFSHEFSVRLLCEACIVDDNKFMFNMNINNTTDKYIQVRPWKLADADYLVAPNVRINTRNTIFVGAVPRFIKAGLLKRILNKNFLVELAHIMDRLYGPVACAGIDTDIEYKYPKGAGRVVFFHASSFNKAISARYVPLYHGDIENRIGQNLVNLIYSVIILRGKLNHMFWIINHVMNVVLIDMLLFFALKCRAFNIIARFAGQNNTHNQNLTNISHWLKKHKFFSNLYV